MPRKLIPAIEIPTFSTPADAAQWYSDHDTADVEAVEVASPFGGGVPVGGLSQVFSVRFDPDTVAQLAAAARRHQMGVTQLVRAWVLERLAADTAGEDVVSWTTGLTDDALAEIRAVVERTVTTAATRHP